MLCVTIHDWPYTLQESSRPVPARVGGATGYEVTTHFSYGDHYNTSYIWNKKK